MDDILILKGLSKKKLIDPEAYLVNRLRKIVKKIYDKSISADNADEIINAIYGLKGEIDGLLNDLMMFNDVMNEMMA